VPSTAWVLAVSGIIKLSCKTNPHLEVEESTQFIQSPMNWVAVYSPLFTLRKSKKQSEFLSSKKRRTRYELLKENFLQDELSH
jgi:hypothetical protein